MTKEAESILGYSYGSSEVPRSSVSLEDLGRRKTGAGFTGEDERVQIHATPDRSLDRPILRVWTVAETKVTTPLTAPRFLLRCLLVALLPFVVSATACAQTTLIAYLPEVDSYFRLSPNVRLLFDAKGYMEDGELNHAQIGPSLQFNVRPFEELKRITVFDLDDMKCMPVVFTIGYHYLPSTVQPAINRLQPIVLFHIPFPGHILLSDRNRADLDWTKGVFYQTYRNRVTAEHRMTLRSYHPGPYVAAEFEYQSQYSKWSITRLFAGCLFPLTKYIQIDAYYQHVNNTGPHPNHQVNAIGTILNFYFPPHTHARSKQRV